MEQCFICDIVGILGNYVEGDRIFCNYDSEYDGEYKITERAPLFRYDSAICDNCLVDLCKEGKIKLEYVYNNMAKKHMGYCDSCNVFDFSVKKAYNMNMFPYVNVIYFWLDQDNFVIRDNMNIIIDNIYCITCITRWTNEGIIKESQPGEFNDRIINKSIGEIKDLIDQRYAPRNSNFNLLYLSCILKHKIYMKDITNRLLLRCFINTIEHPKKNIIFDNNVQEKILSYL